jgi:outer membrane lipoprotein
VPGFLDPDIYAVGRKITVVGVFSGYEKDPIGSYLYDFPVVRTLAVHLWRPRPHYYSRFYYANPWPWGWGIGVGPDFDWGWPGDDDGPGFGP